MRLPLLILPALLAGCATTSGEGDQATAEGLGGCKADSLAQYTGQTATDELGAAALKASGARTLRWGPPRSAMTMDYRTDRLTIAYDDNMKVTNASCG